MFLTLAHLDAGYVRRALSDHRRDVRRRSASTSRAIRFRSVPAAHYMMGGVDTDEWGARRCPGCSRAGEVALHRRARRQPPGQQLAARRAGVRRACGVAMRRRRCAAPLKRDRVGLVAEAGAADEWPRIGLAMATSHQPLEPVDAVRDLMWRIGRTVSHTRDALSGRRRLSMRASARRRRPTRGRAGGIATS